MIKMSALFVSIFCSYMLYSMTVSGVRVVIGNVMLPGIHGSTRFQNQPPATSRVSTGTSGSYQGA